MRGFNLRILLLAMLIGFAAVAGCSGAQSWFQVGAFGSGSTEFNNGASVSIQTVWQNVSNGSLGFWVGETLDNGAFIQVGYQIVNSSGYYPTSCDATGCTGKNFLTSGEPAWFWEYFTAGDESSSFYGGIGGDDSAGANGTFNDYSFRSNGDVWYVYFNNQSIGKVDLGAPDSGVSPPTAVGELAEAYTNTQPMQTVAFKNLEFYSGEGLEMVPQGFSYISYGKDSDTAMPNPYGVKEAGNRVNYFYVGSGLPQQNRSVLWSMGYHLNIVSEYGNISSVDNYSAYSSVMLDVPKIVNISNGTRAVFVGWVGTGKNSYTGSQADDAVEMYNNITETARWNLQYYIGTNSTYKVYGGNWYNNGSTATLYTNASVIALGKGRRAVFSMWSNGASTNSTAVLVDKPETLTAFWTVQYLINATTSYGAVQGAGWRNANSIVTLKLNETSVPVGYGTRLGFYDWSDGNANNTLSLMANAPVSISAIFKKQFLVNLAPEDIYGNAINVGYYNINGTDTNESGIYLFENTDYKVNYVYYKGVTIPMNYSFVARAPETVSLELPVYDVQISAASVFGAPLNASVNVTFDNGTRLVSCLGNAGSLHFQDVPNGHVFGYVGYEGFKRSVMLYGGSEKVLFITPFLIAAITFVIVFAVLLGKLARRRHSGVNKT
jgi:hypothetical protein